MDLSPDWEFVSDRVMGGVSRGALENIEIKGREAARLTGKVSLENNGGFVQIASDLNDDGGIFDASAWQGVALDVLGNDEEYELRLRTEQLTEPWQSFRASFVATSEWTTVRLSFTDFEPSRTDETFQKDSLRRVGVLAIGREFDADLAVAGLRLFR